jgi:hypothetical protein
MIMQGKPLLKRPKNEGTRRKFIFGFLPYLANIYKQASNYFGHINPVTVYANVVEDFDRRGKKLSEQRSRIQNLFQEKDFNFSFENGELSFEADLETLLEFVAV